VRRWGALETARRRTPMGKVVITVLVVAFLLFFIVTYPDKSASIANGAWDHTDNIAHGIGNFVNKLHS
jgi:hypothetical protein